MLRAAYLLSLSLFSLQPGKLSDLQKKLTLGSHREWRKEGDKMLLGQQCIDGSKIFTFYQNDKLVIYECQDGKRQSHNYIWHLEIKDQEPILTLDDGLNKKLSYNIRFINKEGVELLRLASHGKSKDEPTEFIYFKSPDRTR